MANRANGKKGGPKTPEGKAKVSINALKHGLYAEKLILPDEDPRAFESLAERLRDVYQPDGADEEEIVDQLILLRWRLRRPARVETGLFAGSDGTLADAFARHERTFTALSRYEASLERSFHKNLETLERLQAERKALQQAQTPDHYYITYDSPTGGEKETVKVDCTKPYKGGGHYDPTVPHPEFHDPFYQDYEGWWDKHEIYMGQQWLIDMKKAQGRPLTEDEIAYDKGNNPGLYQ
jgi:hypothetical protein